MICIVWLEKPFNRAQEVFSTYRDFIFYLKRNPELSVILKTLQRNKFINKKIQHAYISLEMDGSNHAFFTKNEFVNFLIKNQEIAKSIGFNEVNRKRGEIKVELTDFARRLRESMERKHLSQTVLSKLIGTSQPEVSHYLKSKALPRPYILQRLALVLNVSYYWLKTGEGKMQVASPYPLNEFWTTLNERIVFLFMINRKNW
jgi:transcriptional regulator with XRE-family HTH domain